MSILTLARSCVVILSAAAALSLAACGRRDDASARDVTGSSTANVTPAPPASNTDRSAASTPGIGGGNAATGNSTDTAGSASATNTMGGPAGAGGNAATTAGGMSAAPSSSITRTTTQ